MGNSHFVKSRIRVEIDDFLVAEQRLVVFSGPLVAVAQQRHGGRGTWIIVNRGSRNELGLFFSALIQEPIAVRYELLILLSRAQDIVLDNPCAARPTELAVKAIRLPTFFAGNHHNPQ